MANSKHLLKFILRRKDWIKIWEFYFSIWFLDRIIDVHIKYPKKLGYENRYTLHIYENNKESCFFLEEEIKDLKDIRRKKILSRRYMESHYKEAKFAIKKMHQFINNYLIVEKEMSLNLCKVFLKYSTLLEKILSYYRASRPEIFEIVEEQIKKTKNYRKKYLKMLILRHGKLRWDLKKAWLEAESKSRKMKKKLANQLGLKHQELEQLTNKEIINLWQKKISLQEAKNLIRERRFCVFGLVKGKKILIVGKKAKKIAEYITFLFKQIKEICGKTVYHGVVTGRVKIIPQTSYRKMIKMARKFKKGEILVTGMTQPDVMIAIKKAVAIITDEGGITSHAAIVSRELKIPCIVGTKIATKMLKDGDRVEVDATKGIVKKI